MPESTERIASSNWEERMRRLRNYRKSLSRIATASCSVAASPCFLKPKHTPSTTSTRGIGWGSGVFCLALPCGLGGNGLLLFQGSLSHTASLVWGSGMFRDCHVPCSRRRVLALHILQATIGRFNKLSLKPPLQYACCWSLPSHHCSAVRLRV